MFELVEEAFDVVSLSVKFSILRVLNFTITLWRDDDFGSNLGDPVAKVVGIVAFVGKNGSSLKAVDKIMSKGDVVALSRTGNQADREAKRFRCSMDFRRQSTPRPTQTLGIRPFLTVVHQQHGDAPARWCLSIISHSRSASLASTPISIQR